MFDHEFIKLLTAAMAAKEAATEELQASDGSRYRIEANPGPRIRRRLVPLGPAPIDLQVIVWEPGPDRPTDFPQDAPFLPDAEIVTMRAAKRAMKVTFCTPIGDLDSAVQDILVQGRRAGWTDGGAIPGMPGLLPTRHQQQRGELDRTVAAMTFQQHRMVFVLEMTRLSTTPAA